MYWTWRDRVYVWHFPWTDVTNSGLSRRDERKMAAKYRKTVGRRPTAEDFRRMRDVLDKSVTND